jgi:rubredoxin
VLLLANIGITAVFEDPLYRYDFSLLMFKVMLAGIGCAIVLHFLSRLISASMAHLPVRWLRLRRRALIAADTGSAPERTAGLAWPERHAVASWVFLSILTIIGFWGWAHSLTNAVAEPADGTINVVSASFGANCGAPKDNALQYVRSACSGKQQCVYAFDGRELGNPAETCWKEFQVEWKCSQAGPIESRVEPPEPAQGAPVSLTCQ